jgi:hypothetical protein
MKEIIKKYPKIFKPYEGNPFNVNWDCPDGWLNLLDLLCDSIQKHIDINNQWNNKKISQVHCTQVKEKWATLNFYFNGGDEMIEGMVSFAENISAHVCQECGSTVKVEQHNINGWILTLCEKCVE